VVLCKLSFGNKTIATHALIDCGATGIAFIDEDFARHHQLPLTPLQYPRSLEVIDGRPISSGDITHHANTHLSILEHPEMLLMFVTNPGYCPVVLSIPWLELHNVAIRFSYHTLTFGWKYCALHCNRILTVVRNDSLTLKVASKCKFRFFVEHFYYVCNRNIIPVTTSKILAQKSQWYNFKCK